MLADKRIQYALIVLGLAAALLAILIDPIRGLNVYLHPVQIIVLIAGILVFLVGAYLAFVRRPPIAG